MAKEKFKFYFLWLSLVCVIMFLLQNMPGIPGFTNLFVLNGKAIYNFQIWRFVTAIFLHGGIVHLIYNLFALLFFGVLLEKLIGSKRFLILFFLSGIVANLVSVWFYESSLGASGAIYGILGALMVMRPLMMVWAFGLIMPMFIAGVIWIIGGIIGMFIPSNTGHIAHLSGIGIGILFGLILRISNRKKKNPPLELSDNYIKLWEDRNFG